VEISIAQIAYVSHHALTIMKDDSTIDTTGSLSLARALAISVLA